MNNYTQFLEFRKKDKYWDFNLDKERDGEKFIDSEECQESYRKEKVKSKGNIIIIIPYIF